MLHEKEVTPPHVAQWRVSVHAHSDVSCSDCHRAHHDLPPGTPTVTPPQQTSRPAQDKLVHNAALSKRDSSVHTAASNSAPEPAKTKKPSTARDLSESRSGLSRRLLSVSPGLAPNE